MTTVLLIIQVLICIVLIGLILIQRSEGGALGIGGGGGGGGGLMSGRSSANAVTKATTILGTLFILNCVLLSIFFAVENSNTSALAEDNTETGIVQTDNSDNTQNPNADVVPADDLQSETPDSETDVVVEPTPQEGDDAATETKPDAGDDE
ncbi:preprotein translocase subunit SecG [Robiginitomaculum antarcticum]|uniref:preprotein translocase subunit SecG n=1 Tax=Robiginitomaculum antarcticum TaxID=437507 RepID=UPI000363344B|nr:preprotein translocase subunit SecG [Robiginitomaculum antarcticum]